VKWIKGGEKVGKTRGRGGKENGNEFQKGIVFSRGQKVTGNKGKKKKTAPQKEEKKSAEKKESRRGGLKEAS